METLSAGNTVLFSDRFDVGRKTVLCHFENICSRHIHTRLNAAETHHTTVKPLPDQGGSVGEGREFSLLRGILVLLNPELIGSILELAFPPGIANRAV